jgi:hypothetical protein
VAGGKVVCLVTYWEEMLPQVLVMKMISILEHQKILFPHPQESLVISPVLLENLQQAKLGNVLSEMK